MGGDVWADDLMDRGPSAEFLTTYLLKNPHVKVLNVNSPWGAGKSFFLERWAKSLEESHVCVRFNAWETDYSAEPLVALIACIEEQVVDRFALEDSAVGKGVINVGSTLVKKAGPLIVKGLVKKFSGVDLDDLLVSGSEEAVDDVVKSLLEDQAKTKGDVREFRVEVQRRLQQAAEDKGLSAPAFIFIDELDRCRPTYAIELLERIKHFFELENCRFIIASDSKQLAHSIRAVYGQGFASERYLNRFFDAEFNLDNDDIFALVNQILPEIESLDLGMNVSAKIVDHRWHLADQGNIRYPQKNTVMCSIPGFSENANFVVGLARYFEVELRELVNYVRQIKSAADAIGGRIDFFWLAFLVFYKNSKSESYSVFFESGKGRAAFQDFDAAQSTHVTFSFTFSLDTVFDIAAFYWTLINADKEVLRNMGQGLSGWRGNIYYAAVNNIERLKTYRKIVDLAHRLK